jgi:hypothetical protein
MSWYSIAEYSIRKSISPSTIRRRIKDNTIVYRLEGGKYLIEDTGEQEIVLDRKTPKSIDDILGFAEKTINEISRINNELLDEKERVIKTHEDTIKKLREEINELKMLVGVLDK